MCSGFGLATVVLGYDRQGWITVFAALLLALITLFTNSPVYQLHPCRPLGSRFRRPTAASRNSLHRCRRGGGYRTASWHPTIDVDVERFAIEQRL
jgi:hypothetical protein